jgi:hypothetical protein
MDVTEDSSSPKNLKKLTAAIKTRFESDFVFIKLSPAGT